MKNLFPPVTSYLNLIIVNWLLRTAASSSYRTATGNGPCPTDKTVICFQGTLKRPVHTYVSQLTDRKIPLNLPIAPEFVSLPSTIPCVRLSKENGDYIEVLEQGSGNLRIEPGKYYVSRCHSKFFTGFIGFARRKSVSNLNDNFSNY